MPGAPNSETTRLTQPSKTTLDRLSFAAFIGGIGFLCLVAGMLLGVFETTPFKLTQDAITACKAVFAQQQMAGEEYSPWLWQPIRFDESTCETVTGETTGLTLYTSGADGKATLVNSKGAAQHVWTAPYSKVFPNTTLARSFVPDKQINIRRVQAFDDGSLLALYETPLSTPSGMGIAKLDKNSEVIWTHDGNCHHDFTLDDGGNIYALSHQLKTPQHPKSYFDGSLCIEDFITVLSPDGKLINEFSLLHAYYNSKYYRPDILKRDQGGDLLHTNSINIVGAEFAQHYSEINAGDLMVCFRNINLVAVVDPTSKQIVWATSGPWHFPHDPDPLDNGHILIFDNCFDQGSFVGSRVVEFDPRTSQIAWQYRGPDDFPMRSDIRATQQLLANGNVVIGDSNDGRILEVTRNGEPVWQFIDPVRGEKNHERLIPIMTGVFRYQPGELSFLNQTAESPALVSTLDQ